MQAKNRKTYGSIQAVSKASLPRLLLGLLALSGFGQDLWAQAAGGYQAVNGGSLGTNLGGPTISREAYRSQSQQQMQWSKCDPRFQGQSLTVLQEVDLMLNKGACFFRQGESEAHMKFFQDFDKEITARLSSSGANVCFDSSRGQTNGNIKTVAVLVGPVQPSANAVAGCRAGYQLGLSNQVADSSFLNRQDQDFQVAFQNCFNDGAAKTAPSIGDIYFVGEADIDTSTNLPTLATCEVAFDASTVQPMTGDTRYLTAGGQMGDARLRRGPVGSSIQGVGAGIVQGLISPITDCTKDIIGCATGRRIKGTGPSEADQQRALLQHLAPGEQQQSSGAFSGGIVNTIINASPVGQAMESAGGGDSGARRPREAPAE